MQECGLRLAAGGAGRQQTHTDTTVYALVLYTHTQSLLFLYGFGFEHWVDQWESITVASHHTHHTLPLRGITGRASSASLDYRHAAARLWGSSNHASIAIG